jgi:hypothetical protein
MTRRVRAGVAAFFVLTAGASAALAASHDAPRPAVHGAVHGDVGWLDISCDPAAKIFVDDQDTGKVTPQKVELKAGHHRLTLVTVDGAKKKGPMGFVINAGDTTKLFFRLKQP